MKTYNVENLDGMDQADLRRYADAMRKAKRRARGTDRNVIDCLIRYAVSKADAMLVRLAGRIHEAMRYERLCDAEYKRLPAEYRW